MQYPVLEILPELKTKLNHHNKLILQAPPGAGKSTVLPLQLLEETWLGNRKIIMLEPRRLAARSVAERMSDLSEDKPGGKIGYRVRFDTKVSPATRIEVVTEGILTRMIQSDNALEEVGMLIFDEFHERSLQSDLALALSLQVQSLLREDLRILIMSATLDASSLSGLLDNAPVITSAGRQFPVDIRYSAQESDTHISVQTAQAIRRSLRDDSGDILVFLPGAGEIRRTQQLLEEGEVSAEIFPLFGDLTFKQQQEAILPSPRGARKIVLATSIAETSLTIEGITVVIDSGLSRIPRFDPRSGLTRLETVKLTKDAADQRAGRAGRLGPGICYRLWTEGIHRNLLPQRKPEILEADLSSLMLELFQWGVTNISDLTWMTGPPPGSVAQAKDLLTQLDAIDESGITPRGKEMVKLPTHPRIGHMLLSAIGQREQSIAADVAAVLEEKDVLPKDSGADISLRIEAVRKWRSGERVNAERNTLDRIERLAASWRRILSVKTDNSLLHHADIGRLLIAAYPERLARQQGKQSAYYKLANGRTVKLPDHDPLMHEQWLCIAQLDAGSKEGKIFLAGAVDQKDLEEQALEKHAVRWDDERGMVIGVIEKRVGTLALSSKPSGNPDKAEKNKVLFEVIREKGLRILGWNDESRTLQSRIASLRKWRDNESWPDVSDEALLSTLEEWLTPYIDSVYKLSELGKLDMTSIITGILPWDLQSKLDSLAPLRLPVPSGSNIAIQYFTDGRAPVMEVRLQEMFGLLETPTVNEGRTRILLHLLSPGYKPVQVTQDLKSFWQTTYHEVRKELRMRYPKHSWPEDPWGAVAVRGVMRRRFGG